MRFIAFMVTGFLAAAVGEAVYFRAIRPFTNPNG